MVRAMSSITPTLGLITDTVGSDHIPVSSVDGWSDFLEAAVVVFSEVFGASGGGFLEETDGCATPVGGSLAVEMSATRALVGAEDAKAVVRRGVETISGLPANEAAVYLYLKRNSAGHYADGEWTWNTTGVAPANSILAATCVTGPASVTSVNNLPSGRVNLGKALLTLKSMGLTSKSVAGAADVALSASEYASRVLRLTGVLTGNINVTVDSLAVGFWIVENGTTGSFTLTFKTASGAGVTITQGDTLLLYCDGTDMLAATPGAHASLTTLAVSGFSSLGTGAPAVKQKKLTFTTGAAEGDSVSTAHGLTGAKILGCQAFVADDTNHGIPPETTDPTESQFHLRWDEMNVIVKNHASNSASILSKAGTILITYEE